MQKTEPSYRRGVLEAGKGIVIELIMPITDAKTDLLSEDLLTAMGFGYKAGNFKAYTPSSENSDSSRSLVSDTSDVNMDGITSQSMIRMQLKPLTFSTSTNLTTSKVITTQLETNATSATNGAAAVPEGSSYTYDSAAMNPDGDGKKAAEYRKVVLYDALPDALDMEVYTSQDGQPAYRGSQWHGFITDLDSIKVTQYSAQPALNYDRSARVAQTAWT